MHIAATIPQQFRAARRAQQTCARGRPRRSMGGRLLCGETMERRPASEVAKTEGRASGERCSECAWGGTDTRGHAQTSDDGCARWAGAARRAGFAFTGAPCACRPRYARSET
ncbi:hypothetical protein PHLGIDRAFT_356056 [Phlebiopsis gigantea 11061_1 CR5-6]|uniref:Uncharacterized protein n=1 Tax=Phlebiopsis gigantea (strain 11061_1 CR5-6) TaxID=745531 RepID=A0A0C3NAD5_PHLG1|nr:hypothetical protein PHLGIDRAFT_356056 [Phlebiopsis gigantea 11061_1 CR5-6]